MVNQSGWQPIEYNVLVKQADTEEQTSGGVFLPGETQDRNTYAETHGTLVAVSPMAFAFDDWPKDVPVPLPGDDVLFEKHAGTFVDGVDGEKYRVIKDKQIVAVKS